MLNESSYFFQTCNLLNAKEEIIVKYPSKAFFINEISVSVFRLLLIVPTVTLNGVSIITILKSPHLREKISYFLIMMQSVSDLTVGLVNLPVSSILGFATVITASVHRAEQVLLSRLTALLILKSIVTFICYDNGKIFWRFASYKTSNVNNEEKNFGVSFLCYITHVHDSDFIARPQQ